MGMGMGGPRGGMGYGGMGYGGMGGGMGGGMAGGDRTGKAPDWICSECTNKNFGWRQFCNRCKVSVEGELAARVCLLVGKGWWG